MLEESIPTSRHEEARVNRMVKVFIRDSVKGWMRRWGRKQKFKDPGDTCYKQRRTSWPRPRARSVHPSLANDATNTLGYDEEYAADNEIFSIEENFSLN